MITKIKTIESDNLVVFESKINIANMTHNVFATQTHVTMILDKLVYTAVLFYREESK